MDIGTKPHISKQTAAPELYSAEACCHPAAAYQNLAVRASLAAGMANSGRFPVFTGHSAH